MNRMEMFRLVIVKENEERNINILYNEETKVYSVNCRCLISEERAYKYGESCYRTKEFKYKKCAEKFFTKLTKLSKQYIIKNQNKLF